MFSRKRPELPGEGVFVPRKELTAEEDDRMTVTAGPVIRDHITGMSVQPMYLKERKGPVWFMVRNATPGGWHELVVRYPLLSWKLGRRYRFITGGRNALDGSAPGMLMDPEHTPSRLRDPRGIYTWAFIDTDSGRQLHGGEYLTWYDFGPLKPALLRLVCAPWKYLSWKARRIKAALLG